MIRALRAMTPAPVIVGTHHDRFAVKASLADLNRVLPVPTSAEFVDAVLDIAVRDRINLIIGSDENVVKALSDARDRFPFDLFLPRRETIDLCQDKQALNVFFRDRGIPVPQFYEVDTLDDLEGIFARFEGDGVLWCRARRGSLSLGATAVTNVDQARAWIAQWRDLFRQRVRGGDHILTRACERHLIIEPSGTEKESGGNKYRARKKKPLGQPGEAC